MIDCITLWKEHKFVDFGTFRKGAPGYGYKIEICLTCCELKSVKLDLPEES